MEQGSTSVRLVSRLTSEMSFANLSRSLALVPGRLHESIVMQLLIRQALPFLMGGGDTGGPPPLIGTVGAVARSFERSEETIRRHVRYLAAQGFVTLGPVGVRMAPTEEAGARIRAYLDGVHADTSRLVGELSARGLLTVGPAPSRERMLRFGLDIGLYSFERFRGPIGGWTSMSVWNALSALTVRAVTTDPALSERFRHVSTPDTARRPTSLRGLAAATGLPYPTVRRHVLALEAAGRVARWRGGYAVLTAQLLDDSIEQRVTDYVAFVLARGHALGDARRSKKSVDASR